MPGAPGPAGNERHFLKAECINETAVECKHIVISKIVYFQGGMEETESKDHRDLEDLRDQKVSVQHC